MRAMCTQQHWAQLLLLHALLMYSLHSLLRPFSSHKSICSYSLFKLTPEYAYSGVSGPSKSLLSSCSCPRGSLCPEAPLGFAASLGIMLLSHTRCVKGIVVAMQVLS
jgi:hypothetical protein